MAVIAASRISKRFGSTVALKDVDLTVREGSFFGLFGPNGAGKTTLLRILTGQIEPSTGNAKVLGHDVVEEPMEVKRLVGIVPEVESPPSYLTSYEYLYFVGRIRKVPELDAEIRKWLEYLDLTEAEGTICRDLSKGMRQKLVLAAAFIHEPSLLFLDEPFINLDPIYQKRIMDYLKGYASNGGTIFMCSHILEIAEKLCDHVAIIDRGTIAVDGSLSQIRQNGEDLGSLFHRVVASGGR
jgi:ABC-2 type transport system ATP-binding protein